MGTISIASGWSLLICDGELMGTKDYPGGRPKDESKLSRKPEQIRNRLRRGTAMEADIRMYAEVVWKKPIEEWDMAELAHGMPRNKSGNFQGMAPKWVTRAVQQEAKRRLLTMTMGQLAGHTDIAIRAMKNLIESTEVDDNGKPIVDARTRFAAAAFIIEHVIGKPTAIIQVDQVDETRNALAAAIVLDDGKPQGHLQIEGSIVEEAEMEELQDGE